MQLDAGEACKSGILMKTSEAAKAQFESLLEQHAGIVRKIAFGYARNENDRRDLTQEILLQLWKAYPRYLPERPFSTWMYRIALNVAISSLRKQSRPGREPVPFDESAHDVPHESGVSSEMEERIATLHQLISECQPLDRALLLLYLDGCSYRQIAAVLGLSETNVGTKLNRLKQDLRQNLTDKE
jgi:RNA polymerase sigma-70 factor (ECF subfamily)